MNNTITATIRKIAMGVAVFLVSNSAFAQETANWYFGSPNWFVNTGIRIDFSSGSPVVSTCVPIRTEEGSSSISSASGAPLFYTDGITVWDGATNTVLPGGSGLGGGSSSTQSGIIMPKPGTTNQWLLFTSGANGNPGTAYYTVTGTTPTGPFSVSTGTSLVGAGVVGEGLFIIGSTKVGSSFWVIARDVGTTGVVRAWDVTNAGVVNATAVTSVLSGAGFSNTNYNQTIGTIKSNTCQNMLAFTYFNGVVDVTGFNTATGQVTATARQFSVGSQSYGIEFSSNDQYLYATSLAGTVYRYDIAGNTVAAMTPTTTMSGETGQLQTAPDGNIYLARNTGMGADPSYLGVITNPDGGGTLNPNGILLTSVSCGANKGFSYRGLPTFPKSLVVSEPIVTPGDGAYCTGTAVPVNYSFAGSDAGRTWSVTPATGWSFTTGNANTKNPTITFSAQGTYTVSVDVTDACSRHYTESMEIDISNPKTPNGSVSCSGNNLVLDNTGSDPDEPQYIWYRNSIATNNIIGTGTPFNYALGLGAVLPTQICIGVADAAPTVNTVSNQTIATSNALGNIQVSTPYTSPTIDVLATNLYLQSFRMGFRFSNTISLTVTIRQGATTVYSQTTTGLAVTAGTTFTVPVNTTLLKGTGYTIQVSSSPSGLELKSDNWDGATNANQITYNASLPANSARAAIAHLIYNATNVTVVPVCATPTCIPVGCSLPVEWMDFNAQASSGNVQLSWSTISEINNDYFEIQHSSDGINFTTIGTQRGSGNSSFINEYGFTHLNPVNGINYYRLVQHDYNGAITMSKIIEVAINNSNDFTVSPNPSSSNFQIKFSNLNGGQLSVYDVLGKEISKLFVEVGTDKVDIGTEFSSGVYVLKYAAAAGVSTQRIVKE